MPLDYPIPNMPTSSTENFYKKVLAVILPSRIPFLVGGTYGIKVYTGIERETKDLDLFFKAGDVLEVIEKLEKEGFKVAMVDARWLAKVVEPSDKYFIDLIFSTPQGVVPVDDSWFERPHTTTLFDNELRIVPPEEMIWSKSYRQDHLYFDGPDINHLILKLGTHLDWKKILDRMESHWELLFSIILNFRFVYPSERENVPKWLMEEFMKRLAHQINSPLPLEKITRGPLLARDPYKVDVEQWGFKSIT